MKFSIIIPAYNTSCYLDDCIGSLLQQDFPKNEYEIILIDDASTENIAKALTHTIDIYTSHNQQITPPQQKLPEIRLIRHECNKRQGGARNTGLRNAKGDYVIFLDSDDYWNATNTLSTLHSILHSNKVDILRSVSWNNVSHTAKADFENIEYDNKIILSSGVDHLTDENFFYDIWTACYRREFLLEQHILFRENVVYEDSDWTIKVFFAARKIGLISFPFYIHRLNPESTAMKPRTQTFKDNIQALSAMDDYIKGIDMPDACKKACYARIKKSILSYIKISRHYSVSTSIECLKGIRRELLTEKHRYDLSVTDRIKFFLLLHCPSAVAILVRYLTLTKRLILKCVRK